MQISVLKEKISNKTDDLSLFINSLLASYKNLSLKFIDAKLSIIDTIKKCNTEIPDVMQNFNDPNIWTFDKIFFNK